MTSVSPEGTGLPTAGPLVTPTLQYDPNLNYPGLLTYEPYSAWILGPLAVANSIQIFLGGITLALSLVVWSEKRHRLDAEGKVFLIAANAFNLVAVIIAVLASFDRETSRECTSSTTRKVASLSPEPADPVCFPHGRSCE